jgi:hypothetical protein
MKRAPADELNTMPTKALGIRESRLRRLQERLHKMRDVLARVERDPSHNLLVWIPPEAEPQTRILEDRLVVGRSPAADWVFDDEGMSRRHFEIVRTSAGFELHDLDSHNKTSINDWQVTERALVSGDLIQAGGQAFIFLASPATVPDQHQR